MSNSFRERYEEFIEHAIELEVVWNLQNKDGFALCESIQFEGTQVMPFWSTEKAAKVVCIDDWGDYKPNPVRIDDFIDAWLHGMEEDELYVGINWDEHLEGVEIEPVMLIEDLLGEE
ncbi:MAG: DUF2750 domain-containing protein [Kangiellaceae bacterium]|nr:DUF2750 domain-containing protein [Kangiellaceae bacterium]